MNGYSSCGTRKLLPYLSAIVLLIGVSLPAADAVVWQLGAFDDTNREFISYTSQEFRYNHRLTNMPGYDNRTHTYTYIVPQNGIIERPLFPGGISSPGSANPTWVNRERIVWNDDGVGMRVFKIRITSGLLAAVPGRVNKNVDEDSLVRYSLRITLADGNVTHMYLPNYMTKPLETSASFPAMKGSNSIELYEQSGNTYKRCFLIDALGVYRDDSPAADPVTLEIIPGEGFLHATIYDISRAAAAGITLYNLKPGASYSVRTSCVDFFDAVIQSNLFAVTGNERGQATCSLPMPSSIAGSVRIFADVRKDGRGVPLQMGMTNVMLRTGAVRRIAPLTEAEKDMSFIGLCGLAAKLTYDPYDDTEYSMDRVADYRAYRNILQIYHERFHSLRWPYLEKTQGTYRWDFWDELFAGEKKEGIRLQAALLGTPEWMSKKMYPDRTFFWDWHYSVPDMNEWRRVCTDVAKRYSGLITEFEVWNEPSEHSLYWHKGTAKEYFDLVKTAYEAVKSVDTNIAIVAQTVWAHQQSFIDELYRLGVGNYIDYPADHLWNDESLERRMRFLAKAGSNRGLLANESKSANYNSVERDEPLRKTAAADFVRNTIYGNAHGFLRSYELPIQSYTERDYGTVNPDGTPKYTFFSCKTMVNRTTGARFESEIPLGNNCESFLYRYLSRERIRENGGETALFIFNRDTKARHLRLYTGASALTIVDIMDNARSITAKDGVLDITVTHPVIVIGADPKALQMVKALTLSPETLDVRPDGELSFSVTVDRTDARDGTVRVDGPLFPSQSHTLPFTNGIAAVPLNARISAQPGVYTLTVTAALDTMGWKGNIFREIPVTVSRTGLWENMFGSDPFGAGANMFTPWGSVKPGRIAVGEKGAVRFEFENEGTAGVRVSAPAEIIPGASYYLIVNARGDGTLSCHFNYVKQNGEKEKKDYSFLRETLTAQWKPYVKRFTAPGSVSGCEVNFLFSKAKGYFELSDVCLMRADPLTPLNRVLFRAEAVRLSPAMDGALSEWPNESFMQIGSDGVAMKGYRGNDDCSARFAAGYDGNDISIACEVTDDSDNVTGSDDTKMFMDDSIQFSFEVENKNENTERAAFAVGRVNGMPVVYRSAIITGTDIVPSYAIGIVPEARAVVRREGKTTVYEVTIPGDAIEPRFKVVAGKKIAFALVVNDNDGEGRKGYIEWASGIGNVAGSYYFGSLLFRPE